MRGVATKSRRFLDLLMEIGESVQELGDETVVKEPQGHGTLTLTYTGTHEDLSGVEVEDDSGREFYLRELSLPVLEDIAGQLKHIDNEIMNGLILSASKERFIKPLYDTYGIDGIGLTETEISYLDGLDDLPEAVIKWVDSGSADKLKLDWQTKRKLHKEQRHVEE